jgi:hypothetical protein
MYAMSNMFSVAFLVDLACGCVIIKLSNEMCLSVFSVTMILPCFLCVMLCLLHFHVFMHLHLACHLGMLDEPREGRDGGSSRRWND